MEIFSLGFGCLLGIFVNFGVAVALAYYGLSFWWLLLSSFIANIFAQPLSVRNNILERALQAGHFPRAVFFVWIVPWGTGFAIQLLVYFAAKWLLI